MPVKLNVLALIAYLWANFALVDAKFACFIKNKSFNLIFSEQFEKKSGP